MRYGASCGGGERGRNQVDPKRPLVNRTASVQLDAAEPAIGKFGDETPRIIEQRDIGRYRPDADAREPQPGTPGHAPERRQEPRPSKTPREKADASGLRMVIGEEPQQPLQRAVEQGRMNQVRVQILLQ